jgi:hypothetical protein
MSLAATFRYPERLQGCVVRGYIVDDPCFALGSRNKRLTPFCKHMFSFVLQSRRNPRGGQANRRYTRASVRREQRNSEQRRCVTAHDARIAKQVLVAATDNSQAMRHDPCSYPRLLSIDLALCTLPYRSASRRRKIACVSSPRRGCASAFSDQQTRAPR